MARTRATIEMELAQVVDLRWEARSLHVRQMAHERIMELRAELADLKAAEARQAEKLTPTPNQEVSK